MEKTNIKTKIVVALISLLTMPISAQESSSVRAKKTDYLYTATTVEGVRVGAVTSLLNITSSNVFATTEDIDSTMGVQIGYANIDLEQLGFLATANLLTQKDDIVGETRSLRLDLSLAYGFSPKVYVFGGANLHDFLSADNVILDDMTIGLGGQVGLGFQMTEHIGLTAAFVNVRNAGSTLGVEREISMSGVEIGLSGTF